MRARDAILLALVAGVVAGGVAELVQTNQILQRTQAEGVTVRLLGEAVHLAPPRAGGSAVELPADAAAVQKRMHKVAAGVAAGVLLSVFIVAVT